MQSSRVAMMSVLAPATVLTGVQGAAAQPDVWKLLEGIQLEEVVTENSYAVKKSYPAEMDELGETVEITGYAMQMFADEDIRDLIMVADMGLCPFCGSGDHAGSLQVTLAEPVQFLDESNRITIRGTLSKVTDPETWQAAILENAEIVVR